MRLLDSRPAQGCICLVNLGLATKCAYVASDRWQGEALPLVAAILGALLFSGGAFFTGRYFITGKRFFTE